MDQNISEKSPLFISIVTLAAGIILSGISAFFSVIGLATLFSGAYNSVLVMGGALEFSKIICASWIYRNWKIAPIFMRFYMILASIVLVVITSMGTFGYLSKAYLEKTEDTINYSTELDSIRMEISLKNSEITSRNEILSQLDSAVKKLLDNNRVRGNDGAIATRNSQKEERNQISEEIDQLNKELISLKKRESEIISNKNSYEAEIGPLKYVAEFIYGDDADNQLDNSVRMIILIIVFVFDPLAICMILAGNLGISKRHIKIKDGKEFLELDMENVHEVKIENELIESEK